MLDDDFAECWEAITRPPPPQSKPLSPEFLEKIAETRAFASILDLLSLEDQQLLELLKAERAKFTRADGRLMEVAIVELQRRGVYPEETQPGNPNSVEDMVLSYGVYWYTWQGPLECPACHLDLRDLSSGPPFKREIAVVDRERDRVVRHICPDCHAEVPR